MNIPHALILKQYISSCLQSMDSCVILFIIAIVMGIVSGMFFYKNHDDWDDGFQVLSMLGLVISIGLIIILPFIYLDNQYAMLNADYYVQLRAVGRQ